MVCHVLFNEVGRSSTHRPIYPEQASRKQSASCIRSSRMNVLWFLMDFCQVSYTCGLLKVGKFDKRRKKIMLPGHRKHVLYVRIHIQEILEKQIRNIPC